MATEVPGSVMIIPHQRVRDCPTETVASMLWHLAGARQDCPLLVDAIDLARREHLAAVEVALGRPLDRRRRARSLHTSKTGDEVLHGARDPGVRREGLALLASLGVASENFSTPADAAAFCR
jgi:hypothetical protein